VIVREFQKLRKQHYEDSTSSTTADRNTNEIYDTSDTGNDEVIAHLLQAQFNREYNTILKRTEEKFNRDSKGNTISRFSFSYMIILKLYDSFYFSKYLI
jgi:RIO kinase 3